MAEGLPRRRAEVARRLLEAGSKRLKTANMIRRPKGSVQVRCAPSAEVYSPISGAVAPAASPSRCRRSAFTASSRSRNSQARCRARPRSRARSGSRPRRRTAALCAAEALAEGEARQHARARRSAPSPRGRAAASARRRAQMSTMPHAGPELAEPVQRDAVHREGQAALRPLEATARRSSIIGP